MAVLSRCPKAGCCLLCCSRPEQSLCLAAECCHGLLSRCPKAGCCHCVGGDGEYGDGGDGDDVDDDGGDGDCDVWLAIPLRKAGCCQGLNNLHALGLSVPMAVLSHCPKAGCCQA